MRARDIMTRSVLSVSPDHGFHHPVRLMLDNRICRLPDLDAAQRLRGILAEGDMFQI